MFAFLGVEIVTIAASESPNPAQQISRHALGGVAGLPVLHRLDLPDRRAGAVE